MSRSAVAIKRIKALGKALAPLVRAGEEVDVMDLPVDRHRAAMRCTKRAAAMLKESGAEAIGAPAAFITQWLGSIAAAEDGTFQLEAQWAGLLAHAAHEYRKPMDKLARKLAALTPTAAGLFIDMFRHYPEPDAEWAPPEDWGLKIEEQMIAELEALPMVWGAFASREGPTPHIQLELRKELRFIDLGGPATFASYSVPSFGWANHRDWPSAKWCIGASFNCSRKDTFGSGNSVNVLVRQALAERYFHRTVIAVGPLPGEEEQRISGSELHVALATKTGVELYRLAKFPH